MVSTVVYSQGSLTAKQGKYLLFRILTLSIKGMWQGVHSLNMDHECLLECCNLMEQNLVSSQKSWAQGSWAGSSFSLTLWK